MRSDSVSKLGLQVFTSPTACFRRAAWRATITGRCLTTRTTSWASGERGVCPCGSLLGRCILQNIVGRVPVPFLPIMPYSIFLLLYFPSPPSSPFWAASVVCSQAFEPPTRIASVPPPPPRELVTQHNPVLFFLLLLLQTCHEPLRVAFSSQSPVADVRQLSNLGSVIDHFSHVCHSYTSWHAPCDVPYLVFMLSGC